MNDVCLKFFPFATKTGRENWEARLEELGLEESHPKKLEGEASCIISL